MKFSNLHSWDLTPRDAIELQKRLREKLILRGGPKNPRWIAGVDASLDPDKVWGVVVIWDAETEQLVEQQWDSQPLQFPYVPGLLSFREMPALLAAFAKLKTTPDLILVDGQGIAHPRRLGIASHLGLWLQLPTIGVAKSRLFGQYREPTASVGSSSRLLDQGEQIGFVYRSRERGNPLFISPGNLIGMSESLSLTKRLFAGYRLPEPTRLADKVSKVIKTCRFPQSKLV